MIKKYRNYLLGVIGVLLALTMLVGIKYLMKPKYEELPEVKLKKEINTKKSFAIMVQNGDTYEEYTSEDNTWPGSDYVFKEAKCTDNNGALVENAITFADGKATLKTNQTIYCTLYFDKKPPLNLKTLCENYDNMEVCITNEKDRIKEIEHLSSQGGMYRYQGIDDVPNWICFGTTDNCGIDETDSDSNNIPDGIDKYMYRIIGITKEGQLYLLKETFLKEETSTSFTWNDRASLFGGDQDYCNGGICPEWPDSLLFKRINGISNGTTPGTGNYSNNANTDIFVDSSVYDYLKSGDSINGTKDDKGSEWYQLIANHEWMYGDTNESKYNGSSMYNIETGNADTTHKIGSFGNLTIETYRWSKEEQANGKISLMYIHDVLYAYPGGNPGKADNVKNSWIYFQKDEYNLNPSSEWLSTRYGISGASISPYGSSNKIVSDGQIDGFSGCMNGVSGTRPVFYLTSDVKLKEGTEGTKTNPYILSL